MSLTFGFTNLLPGVPGVVKQNKKVGVEGERDHVSDESVTGRTTKFLYTPDEGGVPET